MWVRDLVSGSTTLASRADGPGGAPATGAVFGNLDQRRRQPRRVRLERGQPRRRGTGTDFQVHVRDLTAGTTMLASRADGAAGATANAPVQEAILSGDGAHVAFATRATNLGDGDTDPQDDVHVRDLVKGTTRLADVAPGGAKANAAATEPSIDANGTRVAFTFLRPTSDPRPSRPARTRCGCTTSPHAQLCSPAEPMVRMALPASLPRRSRRSARTGGGAAAFELRSRAALLRAPSSSPYVPPPPSSRVPRAPQGSPSPTDTDFAGGITADGGCVAFDGDGALLGVVPGSADYPQTYLRVFKPDCGGRTTTAFGSNDKTLPLLRLVSLTHKRFRVAKARTPLAAGARAHRQGPGPRRPPSLHEQQRGGPAVGPDRARQASAREREGPQARLQAGPQASEARRLHRPHPRRHADPSHRDRLRPGRPERKRPARGACRRAATGSPSPCATPPATSRSRSGSASRSWPADPAKGRTLRRPRLAGL